MRRPPYKHLYEELKVKIPILVSSISIPPLSLIEQAEIVDVINDWEDKLIQEYNDRKRSRDKL